MKVIPKILTASALFIAAASGCQSEEARLREEAGRLVELCAGIQYNDPPDVREKRLATLEQAVFVSPDVVAARTVCLSGHRQLLQAQRSQDETAKELDKALAQTDGGGPLAVGTIERLQGTLASAQTQLRGAQAELTDCEARVRALDVRFGRR
ncbi:MAG: hypothetical protein QM778_36375 [Myxococcales bacterium]